MTVYIGNFLNAQGEIDKEANESKWGYDVKIIQSRRSFFYRYRYVEGSGIYVWKMENIDIPNKVKVVHVNPKIIEVHMCYITVLLKKIDLEECQKFYFECKKTGD